LGQNLNDAILAHSDFELIATSKGANRHPATGSFIYEELDICDQENVSQLIGKYRPDSVIHTAAMTNVDTCESEKELCYKLNVDAVKNLIAACEQYNTHLVHLSTDFIFDGENGPYSEDDGPNPLSYYGQTKLEAEELIKQARCSWAILRTIIVYGIVNDMSRTNIVLWAKGALEKGAPINVVNDQWRMPTLAEDLADCCLLAAAKKAQGVFNASGKDMLSIIELVEQVAEFWSLDKGLINPISSDSLNQTAKRPRKTGFILDKTISELGYKPHSFKEGLALLDKQLKKNIAG